MWLLRCACTRLLSQIAFAAVGLTLCAPPTQRPRFENAKTTLSTLLSPPFSSVPIINENDTVSVSELRFGDNDTLSAIAAGIVDADYLFLCTDVDGLYTGNPNADPSARRLGVVSNVALARKAGT